MRRQYNGIQHNRRQTLEDKTLEDKTLDDKTLEDTRRQHNKRQCNIIQHNRRQNTRRQYISRHLNGIKTMIRHLFESWLRMTCNDRRTAPQVSPTYAHNHLDKKSKNTISRNKLPIK